MHSASEPAAQSRSRCKAQSSPRVASEWIALKTIRGSQQRWLQHEFRGPPYEKPEEQRKRNIRATAKDEQESREEREFNHQGRRVTSLKSTVAVPTTTG
eukprot:5543987-Pleurochrysis_carterae.AAC.1